MIFALLEVHCGAYNNFQFGAANSHNQVQVVIETTENIGICLVEGKIRESWDEKQAPTTGARCLPMKRSKLIPWTSMSDRTQLKVKKVRASSSWTYHRKPIFTRMYNFVCVHFTIYVFVMDHKLQWCVRKSYIYFEQESVIQ